MLKGKTVAVFVSGGIAAYKACDIVSRLKKSGVDVHVVLTKNAMEFVSALTFETLSNNKVITEMFDKDREWEVEHIALAKRADLFLIAPATANIIGKIAHGIADDFATTTIMAARCPILIAPAMNTNMYQSAAYQHNQKLLTERGFVFIEPDDGILACGDSGKGRLCEVEKIISAVKNALNISEEFLGKHILITLGGTKESIDPVRHIGNKSSGKMGLALANAALNMGARVTVVAGDVSVDFNANIMSIIRVQTTAEMLDAVMAVKDVDYYIMAAAPADYRIDNYSGHKIKGESITLKLIKNPDIAQGVGNRIRLEKSASKLIIFCAETENLLENARIKMVKKGAHMVVANNILQEGAGFNSDTNIATIITGKEQTALNKMLKKELAQVILNTIHTHLQ